MKADLRCITGLHIGGTVEGFEIGGMDNPVIKDPITGYPYIPGSSLKGKMRSLLEWTTIHNNKSRVEYMVGIKGNKISAPPCNCSECDVCIVFGAGAGANVKKEPTRLIVRDSFPKGLFGDDGKMLDENNRTGTIQKWKQYLGKGIYTEVKTENAIDRITSAANPRSMERVPVDSVFEVEMIFDVYRDDDKGRLKKVFEGMSLLEDSYLGGGGSRGSGKISFEDVRIIKRDVNEYYIGGGEDKIILEKKTVRDILKNFDAFSKNL
ncbi:MAG: type III-A CRISPR-associated RAMP protein Csm3 [Candidatus Calescibacterium sp.]|nr:type III-A CRISPR-associated RAMP protein Csm3 [Candidatus Calescibacterium sp.]